MTKGFFLVLITLVLVIITLFIIAYAPSGSGSPDFDQPATSWSSIGKLISLFVPPLIFSFFNNNSVKIIFAIYQCFLGLVFLGIILLGFIFSNGFNVSISDGGFWIMCIGIIGTVISIISVFDIARGIKENSVVN
ncbi:hypothetical protein SH601_04895 [Gracilibacillus sp. S3-1-1]|uniref:Uncharacterized protein n=1 Tax=Gracilibacillus pellucidus TaxID=3095368 RepID=A0ACC6M375_9BACI|nr:hypothetical protein [Gracilibacillus sp. S3-1-1]MDX8045320.1 hypothetical protein [Gracilibacillus sp. S3-1-1]